MCSCSCWPTTYVTTQWIEGDPAGWNHHDTDGPRTNNHLEGWHGRLKKIIGKAHPNVFEMVKFLLDEQKLNELRTVRYEAGQRLPPKKAKYQNMNNRLDNLKFRLATGAIQLMHYADAASHLLKMWIRTVHQICPSTMTNTYVYDCTRVLNDFVDAVDYVHT